MPEVEDNWGVADGSRRHGGWLCVPAQGAPGWRSSVLPVSLTSQIEWAGSPFMRFAQKSIPNPGAVTAVHDGIRKQALRTKSSHTGKRPDWGLIGTAIDFRLRLAFTTDELVPVSARRGHTALTRNHPEAAALLGELTAAIATTLAEAPHSRPTVSSCPNRSRTTCSASAWSPASLTSSTARTRMSSTRHRYWTEGGR